MSFNFSAIIVQKSCPNDGWLLLVELWNCVKSGLSIKIADAKTSELRIKVGLFEPQVGLIKSPVNVFESLIDPC